MANPSSCDRDAVTFRSVTKSFGPLKALDDVSFSIAANAIHAVVGENGAGKSTLVKVLAGEVRADSGHVAVHGQGPSPRDPRDAARRGVGMVHQEFLLAPQLRVWENVVLGWEGRRFSLRSRELHDQIRAVSTRYGMRVPLDERVEDLPIAAQQRVEILKALFRGADVLVLDEPTAVLTPIETQGLFEAMAQLRDQGKTLVFVSHKLKEVLSVATTITVMRGGEDVAVVAPEDTTEHHLAELIIGRQLQPVQRRPLPPGTPAVVVDDVFVPASEGSTGLRGCSFTANRSEVLGIAGVSGNGQDELVRVVSGALVPASGSVRYPVLGPHSSRGTAAIRGRGLSYVPADRLRTATAPGEPLWFSAIPGRTGRVHLWQSMQHAKARAAAEAIRDEYGVKAGSVDVLPSQLSGGNLQKYIVGREIGRTPRVLLAHEPTRGIDIGAARQLRQRLRDLAESGVSVILVSSDLDELLETSDRMLVLSDGVITADVDPAHATVHEIGLAMTAGHGVREEL